LGFTPAQTRAKEQALWTPFPLALAFTLPRRLSTSWKGFDISLSNIPAQNHSVSAGSRSALDLPKGPSIRDRQAETARTASAQISAGNSRRTFLAQPHNPAQVFLPIVATKCK